jgi:hypothetical protein
MYAVALQAIFIAMLLGIVLQAVHMVYNIRSILGDMREIETRASGRNSGKGYQAIIPCRISSSSPEEVGHTIDSIERSFDAGVIDRAIIVTEPGETKSLERLGRYGDKVEILESLEGICRKCSGKNKAILTALKAIEGSEGDVVIFLDCDAHHNPKALWYALRASHAMGVIVTGYRWYTLRDIYSVLHNMVSSIAFEHMGIWRTRIIWGGLVAIPSHILRSMGLWERLSEELSDDAVMGSEARRRGYRFIFCRRCISPTPAQRSIASFYRWAVRQMVILRLYTPLGFKILMAIYSIGTIFMITLPASLIAVKTIPEAQLAALVSACYIAIGSIRGAIAIWLYSPHRIYRGSPPGDERIIWRLVYIALAGVRAPLILAILISATRTRRFSWRGTEYCIENRRAVPCRAIV